ncbi:MAG TPA: hypothetical protein VEO95_11015 [Chthoniobacteraceae bacterium]|nr:hypothetical protein [Chthoniobacteraceae bacterium]
MNIGIYKSASALVALDRWQEAISQNIASASVPGFRKNEAAFESKPADMERFGADARSVKEARGVMPAPVSQISLQPGERGIRRAARAARRSAERDRRARGGKSSRDQHGDQRPDANDPASA